MSNISQIISGGQTGADRAALDFAIESGISHGGWCPAGRRAEDGKIPTTYLLLETKALGYRERTKRNIVESDGTVVFIDKANLTPGTRLTINLCRSYGKPVVLLSTGDLSEASARLLRDWIEREKIRILNVAGSRESKAPGIGNYVREVLKLAVL